MLDLMKKTIARNLLKYSAGMHITCPHCDTIADYRRWVILDRTDGSTAWTGCSACFDKLSETLGIPDTWTVTRESAPRGAKSPRGASAALPVADAIKAYARKRQRQLKAVKRVFPSRHAASTYLISTADYVREYLRLNNRECNFVDGLSGYKLNSDPYTLAIGPACEEVTE